jgi:hypothetical protein
MTETKRAAPDLQKLIETPAPPVRRRKRQSHSLGRLRLSVPHHPTGYYCRWVNDDGIEVAWRLENDYEFCCNAEVGLPPPAEDEEDRVKRLVGTKENGDALYAYLMKIRQEWRDEDVWEEGELQRNFEKQVKSGTIVGEGQTAEKRYIPNSGISINRT